MSRRYVNRYRPAKPGSTIRVETLPILNDPVNPAHYQGDYCMRVIEDFKLDFCLGTVIKYVLRAGKKQGADELEDLKKAAWYLNRKITKLGG